MSSKKSFKTSEDTSELGETLTKGTLTTVFSSRFLKKKPKIGNKILIPVLFLVIQLNLGSYYSFDVPQELANNFTKKFRKSPADVEFLYSLWALSAIPLGLISGIIIKKISALSTALLCSFLITVSGILTNLAIEKNQYKWIIIGRILLGFAAEPLMVAQSTLISEWFTGKYLSLASGLSNAMNNLGQALGYFLSSLVYVKSRDMASPFFYSTWSNVFSTVCCILYGFYDLKYLEKVKEANAIEESLNESDDVYDEGDDEEINLKYLKDLFDIRIILSILLFNFGELTYFMFTNISTEFMIRRFNYDILEAKNLILILPLSTVFFIPFYSTLSIKKGIKTKLYLLGYIFALISYVLMAILPVENTNIILVSMVLIGQFWSIVGSIVFSSIIIVTPSRSIPLVLGVGFFFNDIFLTIVPFIFGKIVKKDDIEGYQNALYGLVVLAVIGIILSLIMLAVDKKRGGILDLPENSVEASRLKMAINKRARESDSQEVDQEDD